MFIYEMLSYNIAVLDWACCASYNGKSKYDQYAVGKYLPVNVDMSDYYTVLWLDRCVEIKRHIMILQ